MSNIKKFTTINATIIIDDATKLQFHHNKCYQIATPYILAAAYQCKEYVLLHELQGYYIDKPIEAKEPREFQKEIMGVGKPHYDDFYEKLHDKLSIESISDKYYLMPRDSFNGVISPYKDKDLKSFHLFKVDATAWTEVELDLEELHKQGLIKWTNFANGIINT